MTFDGLRYVVAWSDSRDFGAGYPEVYARRVERDGVTLLPEFEIASRTASTPLLASNGQGALVVYEGGNNLYGRMLPQEGGMGAFISIATLEGYRSARLGGLRRHALRGRLAERVDLLHALECQCVHGPRPDGWDPGGHHAHLHRHGEAV